MLDEASVEQPKTGLRGELMTTLGNRSPWTPPLGHSSLAMRLE
jgi:hypothetical protein